MSSTLPPAADVLSVADAVHDNQMMEYNLLGGVVARRALKLYVLRVPPPPPVGAYQTFIVFAT